MFLLYSRREEINEIKLGRVPGITMIAPERLQLSIPTLREKAEFAEIDLKRDLSEVSKEVREKFIEYSPVENPQGFNSYMVLREWLSNAEFRGGADLSKSRCFVSKHEDYFYLGLEDNGFGFFLRPALKNYVGPDDRGKGLSVICRMELSHLYNINEEGKHTIIGLKRYYTSTW